MFFDTHMRDEPNGRDWSYDFWIDQKTKQLVEAHVPGADIYDPNKDRPYCKDQLEKGCTGTFSAVDTFAQTSYSMPTWTIRCSASSRPKATLSNRDRTSRSGDGEGNDRLPRHRGRLQ